ncbi:MAG: hypothetical protein NUV85_00240, partial [Candidatus Berkelbacteria bacterium]|nr:hypothetical protein [Candidatus Berkelbacteria bacterium]
METLSGIRKPIFGLFLFSLLCGFGKHLAANSTYQEYNNQITVVAKMSTALHELETRVQTAKIDHPKYTTDLNVDDLVAAINQEKLALEKADDTPDPRPVSSESARAKVVVARVKRQIDTVNST